MSSNRERMSSLGGDTSLTFAQSQGSAPSSGKKKRHERVHLSSFSSDDADIDKDMLLGGGGVNDEDETPPSPDHGVLVEGSYRRPLLSSSSTSSVGYGTARPQSPASAKWRLFRIKLRRVTENIFVRIFGLLLIFLDVALLLNRLSQLHWDFESKKEDPLWYEYTSYSIIIYFGAELLLRMIAIGPTELFSKKLEIFDALVICTSIVLTFAFQIARIVIIARMIRVLILFRFCNESEKAQLASRLLVSGNKTRFRKGGFDLDLTYITDRVIAMSYPSEGTTSLYRNPMSEVVRFFETRHGGHYMIYNICAEGEYSPSHFSDRVVRCRTDDHNPPLLPDLYKLCLNAQNFLRRDALNVISVHCKGGKGRSGTVICSYLVFDRVFPDAAGALNAFAAKRTDFTLGSKYQGVQTPSQARYVNYVERLMTHHGGSLPPPVTKVLSTIRIVAMKYNPVNPLWFQIFQDNVLRFSSPEAIASGNLTMQLSQSKLDGGVTVNTMEFDIGTLQLTGDIKFKFFGQNLPYHYDDCAFYFWFNTSMLPSPCHRFALAKHELDNPHKSKYGKHYHRLFSVDLYFGEDDSSVDPSSSNSIITRIPIPDDSSI